LGHPGLVETCRSAQELTLAGKGGGLGLRLRLNQSSLLLMLCDGRSLCLCSLRLGSLSSLGGSHLRLLQAHELIVLIVAARSHSRICQKLHLPLPSCLCLLL